VREGRNGYEALQIACEAQPDVILLDVMMPGIDGYETCRRLKGLGDTAHIPVIMLTGLDDRESRLRAFDAGAEDFLARPLAEPRLLARIESLVRGKALLDELRLRARPDGRHEYDPLSPSDTLPNYADASVLLTGIAPASTEEITAALRGHLGAAVETTGGQADARALAAGGRFDAFIVGDSPTDGEQLRIAAMLRTLPPARSASLMLLVPQGRPDLAVTAFEMGASDVMEAPIETAELVARLRVQLRRTHFAEQLRRSVQASFEMAVTDPLTGLYNRRYANAQLSRILSKSGRGRTAAMLLDLDNFKTLNDLHGHAAGDCVLAEFAGRLRKNVRQMDLVARIGGEEFLVVMPEVQAEHAARVAERVRDAVERPAFALDRDGTEIALTVSIGLACHRDGETPAQFVARADEALYASKSSGRNTVTVAAV